MIERWLNYILHLSSYIYKKKDELLVVSVSRCIINAIIIFFLEIYLGIITLPIFLFIPEKKIKTKKYKTEKPGAIKLYFANLMIIIGVLLIIISFYSISVIVPSAIYILIIIALFIFLLYAIYSKTWTNLTFKTSNHLYVQKRKLIESTKKLPSIILSFYIVVLELFLLVISFPVYIFIKPEELKGIKGKRFKLRRKLTFIYLGFLIIIFIFQVTLAMLLLSCFYAPNLVSLN